MLLLDLFSIHKCLLFRTELFQTEEFCHLNYMILNDITVGGARSPAAETPGLVWFQGGWRAAEASKTSRPCTGPRFECGLVPVGSLASTSAPAWRTVAGQEKSSLKQESQTVQLTENMEGATWNNNVRGVFAGCHLVPSPRNIRVTSCHCAGTSTSYQAKSDLLPGQVWPPTSVKSCLSNHPVR